MKKEMILDVLREMNDNEIATIWNEYCREVYRYDDEIMTDYEMEEYAKTQDVMNILNRFYFGNDDGQENTSANPNRNFFTFNGYGNIISFDYIYNKYADEFYYVDVDEMIDYIIENEDSLYCDEIQSILDEDMEDSEEV